MFLIINYISIVGLASILAAPTMKTVERIINGEDSAPGSHPHQVTLQYTFLGYWYHVCGGSVIGDTFVLTAGHCVDFADADQFRVVVNDNRLYEDEGQEQIIAVKRIHVHQDFINGPDRHWKLYPNDIAVLVLENKVTDTSTIIPMAADKDGYFSGDTCTISGWGLNDTDGDIPNILQEVNMTVMSQEECATFWKQIWIDFPFELFLGQICIFAGEDPVTGASACNGDSGGPMVCDGVLAGVTSWGVNGCRDWNTTEFRPSVYARVSYYHTWIQTVMGKYQIARG